MNLSKDVIFNIKTDSSIKLKRWIDRNDDTKSFNYFSFHKGFVTENPPQFFIYEYDEDVEKVNKLAAENSCSNAFIDEGLAKQLGRWFNYGINEMSWSNAEVEY